MFVDIRSDDTNVQDSTCSDIKSKCAMEVNVPEIRKYYNPSSPIPTSQHDKHSHSQLPNGSHP